MGGVKADTGDFRQGDRLRGRGDAPEAVVVAIGGSTSAECDVRRYFGNGKGSALGIQQKW